MNQHQFSLPYPPSLNTYWRHVVVKGRVRVLISARGRAYRKAVMEDRLVRKAPPLGAARLKVTIQAYPPDRRARDLDNLPKAEKLCFCRSRRAIILNSNAPTVLDTPRSVAPLGRDKMNNSKKDLPPVERLWDMYREVGSVHRLADQIGISHSRIHRALLKAGYVLPGSKFSPEEDEIIRRYYAEATVDNFDLQALVNLLPNRQYDGARQNICRRASALGLTNTKRKSAQHTRQAVSIATQKQLKENGHPKGMLGKKHTPEALALVSRASTESWARKTEEERAARNLKMMQTRDKNGTRVPSRHKASWKQGWREINGRRIYFRSQWEVNYARYLQWLKDKGQILEWEFEPETFWFEGVKRGTMSYLPDFRITENDGSYVYHEIKGWMDDRSKTKLKRMAKYHPEVKLILIDSKIYKALAKQVKGLVPEWE